jgi:hypothetical protein
VGEETRRTDDEVAGGLRLASKVVGDDLLGACSITLLGVKGLEKSDALLSSFFEQ